jgi:hypothetical protein
LLVNLDKREFVNPHQVGAGLKLWEQLATHPGTGAAMIVLCAAMPEARGGGDLSRDSEAAQQVIGRWAGDRIALVGDYAEDSDLPTRHRARRIYGLCQPHKDGATRGPDPRVKCACRGRPYRHYTDISALVATVLERELAGKFSGEGWRDWTPHSLMEQAVVAATREAKKTFEIEVTFGRDTT